MGLKLDLVSAFSWRLLILFLFGTCIVKILSVSLAGRFAGFRGLDLVNLALTTNARGGPGIVLASVAFGAKARHYLKKVAFVAGTWIKLKRHVHVCKWPKLT